MKLNLAVTALLVGIGVSMHGKNDQRIPFGRRPPASGLLCPVDEKLFPTEKNPGFNRPEWLKESSLVDSPDDIKLLESIRHLGRELGAFTLRI